jgi:hypothetical protein
MKVAAPFNGREHARIEMCGRRGKLSFRRDFSSGKLAAIARQKWEMNWLYFPVEWGSCKENKDIRLGRFGI